MSPRSPGRPAAAPKSAPQPAPKPAFSSLMDGAGSRLAAARLALGYRSQTSFARAFNITSQRLNQWENGVHPPDLVTMCALKARHGVPLDWIYLDDSTHLPMFLAQAITSLGAQPDAPVAAVKLRYTFGNPVGPAPTALHDLPAEPYRPPPRGGFAEAQDAFANDAPRTTRRRSKPA